MRALVLEAPGGRAPLEPIKEFQVDGDAAFVDDVVNAPTERQAELIDLRPSRQDEVQSNGFQQPAPHDGPSHGDHTPGFSPLRAVKGSDRRTVE